MAINIASNTVSNPLSSESAPTLTVLWSKDHPSTKRYYVDEMGTVRVEAYQNAIRYMATPFRIVSIRDFARLISHLSGRRHMLIVRGLHSRGKVKDTWRDNNSLPEHPDGTPWVMLDIDGEPVSEGISEISVGAVRWLIQNKLPEEFRNVTCFYQFSGSAGILKADGCPLKPGLRVHLFFMLNRRVPGKLMAGYLRRHCIDTGFYSIDANKGGVAQFKHGIDPSPIRTACQPHYIAHPMIEEGVHCALTAENRQGLIEGEKDVVTVPDIDYALLQQTNMMQTQLREAWMKERGYRRTTAQVLTTIGPAHTRYFVPPNLSGEVRRGRVLHHADVNGSICRLFFCDESSPGSWYVKKFQPQLACRYGDGECIPLKEISDSAYHYVRDSLRWFTEVPGRNLPLDAAGYLPEFSSFITAKYSLVLAPTGSGKTTKVIAWMREKARECVVVYVAQTIPLVAQMREDLAEAEIECVHYQDVHGREPPPSTGIFVTTNESMPKILRYFSCNSLTAYHLVVDEVHMALDDFCRDQRRYDRFCSAIAQARSVIFMTGTFTEIQRNMLSGIIARLEGGSLTEQRYCTYEFASVKQNPLTIRKLDHFRQDVIELFSSLREKNVAGQNLPRVMILLSSSKMEMFRILVEQYGLVELADIISRPENLQGEIEAARVSDKPILITSPLFSVGLNLERQLEVLYCRFDHLAADSSRIVQTINRANRGDVACEVRIYANPKDEPFAFPAKQTVLDQMRGVLIDETDVVNNAINMPLLLDRMAYRQYRSIECDPNKAMGQLIRGDDFQNYRVVECLESKSRDKEKAKQFSDLKELAGELYDRRVFDRLPRFFDDVADCHFYQLQKLDSERRNGWRMEPDEQRTSREIEDDELAVLMHLCDLDSPAKARRVSKSRLRVLFGDKEPWLSDNANAAHYVNWAAEAAEKTASVQHVVEVIRRMATGEIDNASFADKLNRDKSLQKGIRALAKDERDFVALDRSFRRLAELRENVRKSNTFANHLKAAKFALAMSKSFLESIGVFSVTEGEGEGEATNSRAAIVPATWDFEYMTARLKHRRILLRNLPNEFSSVNRELDPREGVYAVVLSLCRRCKFFDAACCAIKHRIDWTEFGIELDRSESESTDSCSDFSPVRQVTVV